MDDTPNETYRTLPRGQTVDVPRGGDGLAPWGKTMPQSAAVSFCYNQKAPWCCFTSVRKWWNWQTHHLEGVAPKGVGVQIPPSAPSFQISLRVPNRLLRSVKTGLGRGSPHSRGRAPRNYA